LNYIIGDQARYDVPGKSHILDRMLPWSKQKGLGHYKLADVTTPVITRFMKSFEKAGASYDLRSRVLSTLRRIFNYAIRTLGWVYISPTDGVEGRKAKAEMTGKIEVPQAPHIDLLLRVANPLQALLLEFTCTTGLRVGEVMALQWANINWKDKEVKV